MYLLTYTIFSFDIRYWRVDLLERPSGLTAMSLNWQDFCLKWWLDEAFFYPDKSCYGKIYKFSNVNFWLYFPCTYLQCSRWNRHKSAKIIINFEQIPCYAYWRNITLYSLHSIFFAMSTFARVDKNASSGPDGSLSNAFYYIPLVSLRLTIKTALSQVKFTTK